MKKYYAPTPVRWRKAGDALLAAGTTFSAYAVIEEIKWLALTGLFVGVAGKFLTNLFTENEEKKTV